MSRRANRRWRDWRIDEFGTSIRSRGGITNDQARELAALQRAARVPYTGAGMTRAQADAAIRAFRKNSDPEGSVRGRHRALPTQGPNRPREGV